MADLAIDADFGDQGKPLSVQATAAILKRRFANSNIELAWSMGNSTQYGQVVDPDLGSSIAPTLSVGGGAPPPGTLDTFFVELAKSIPEEMRTEGVLRQGDLRPLLNQVQGQGEVDELEQVTAGDGTFTPLQRRLAGALMVTETVDQTEKYQAALQGRGLSPEAIAVQVAEFRRGYTDGTIRRIPQPTGNISELDPETGLPMASSDASADVADAGLFDVSQYTEGGAEVEPFEYISPDDLERLLQEGSDTDARVQWQLGQEAQGEATAEMGGVVTGDPTRVTYEQGRARRTGQLPPGASPQAQRGWEKAAGRTTYGLSEVVRLPATMTRQEVSAISKKLEKGGFYDLAGGKPVSVGDPTDPQFKRAWRLLVGQSLETGKPMMSLLDDRMAAYQEQIDEALMTKLTDPARIRTSVDAVGRSMLGRKLRPDEHDDMIKFVHELERRNARLEAGLDPNSDEEGDNEMIMADIEARIDEELRANNETEALSHDVAGQYDVFSNLLRGPGRGI